jgi:hypothetical protein
MESAPSPQSSPPKRAREEQHRWHLLLWAFNALLLVAAVVLWQKLRWRKVSDMPTGITWHRSFTTHVDRNRDGRVDEETIRLPDGDAVIRRDSDLDGWFDLRYVERKGLATRLEQIREQTPSH